MSLKGSTRNERMDIRRRLTANAKRHERTEAEERSRDDTAEIPLVRPSVVRVRPFPGPQERVVSD